ncbi:MAG: DegT/DnrJ/EryC1/StrS family aminotransferase [Desulfobacterales bacterium]|nr:DegT/DnrJ/EryC1/StrS family aminotransferase [Desulfobacterales bacterium]
MAGNNAHGKVRFLNLSVIDPVERNALMAAMEQVLRHGMMVNGPELTAFEEKMARFCRRKYAVGVGSGTDALYLALRALDIGPGDEVITTCLSWVATANAIALTGATPVFADIGPDLNVDPADVARCISAKTRAIVPVHYTGRLCDMAALGELGRKHGLHIVEDAAQAFGARLGGRVAGESGILACFSFNPMKVYGACGEAGMVVTDSSELQSRLESLRYNGTVNKETCVVPGLNCRMDTLQAALLLARFPYYQKLVERRRSLARIYDERLAGVVDIPGESPDEYHVYYTYTIQSRERDKLKAFLEDQGIETKIQHPLLLPDQPAHRNAQLPRLPRARDIHSRILCIPIHEKLDTGHVEYIGEQIRTFHGRAGR